MAVAADAVRRGPLAGRWRLDWESASWLAILAATLITRLWDLGARAMSHDESLHTYYSWKLFVGEGYAHDPMMHGPLLYHATALNYWLFGASDFTARLHAVSAGLILVLSPLLLRKWLGRVGALATGLMLLLSPSVMMYSRYIRHDIPVELFTVLMVVGLFRYLDDRRGRWIVLSFAAAAGAITSAEMSYITGFILVTFLLVAMASDAVGRRGTGRMAVALAALGIGLLAFALLSNGGALGVPPAKGTPAWQWEHAAFLFGGLALAWALAAAMLAAPRAPRELLAAIRQSPVDAVAVGVATFVVIYVLFFTTFFTNPDGLDGFVASVRYWLDQHDVVRGDQPWYYYLLLAPLYEYLPLVIAFAGAAFYLRRPDVRSARGDDGEPGAPAPAAALFVPLLITWMFGAFWIFSWAGEKMPWLTLHLAVPMAFVAGRFVADVAERIDLAALRQGGWQVVALVAGGILAVAAIAARDPGPGAGASSVGLVLGGLVVVLVAAGIGFLGKSLGRRQTRLAVAAGVAAALLLGTVRTTAVANFQNDELATEYLVYAHGTPDDKVAYDLMRTMEARLQAQGESLAVGYDNEVSWPFTWYFRRTDWSTEPRYLDQKPSDVPTLLGLDAILVGSPNYGNFEPYLRDDYVAIDYVRMWWPNEGYKGMTWDRLVETLTNPRLRRNLLNIVLRRAYVVDPLAEETEPKPLDDWYHHADMKLFVRRETVAKVWPNAADRPEALVDVDVVPSPDISLPVSVDRVYDAAGDVALSEPKDIALGPDGTLWIADLGNARVVGLDEEGELVATLGEGALRYDDGNGGTPPSAWGVGVGPDGAVYVADTWNHRVLRFENGRQTGSFGVSGVPANPAEELDKLFGPRDVAVGPDGEVFLTDTGNKRIVVLDQTLRAVRAIGGGGSARGQFNEPTSLAFDPETGKLVIADLWNLRVQTFSADFLPEAEWQVDGWESTEAAHKGYLAVGPGGVIVATDPVGSRLWFYRADGTAIGTFDLVDDDQGLREPIGVAVDAQGRIYVASSTNGRVTRYLPPDAVRTAMGLDAAADEAPVDATAVEAGEGEDAATGADEAVEEPAATGEGAATP